MKKRTAVYLRVSTSQQNVASQSNAVRKWLEGHGIDDARWYIDQGESGVGMVRARFRDLQQAIFNGEHHQVIMYSLDRFSRCMVEGLVELDKWRKAGVKMVFIDDMLEIGGGCNDPLAELFTKIMVSVRLAFAEAEREKMLRRQNAGYTAARRQANKVRRLRRKGKSPEEISKEVGIPTDKVRKILAAPYGRLYWANGRPKGNYKADPMRAYELREQGFSVAAIASRLDVSMRTVSDYCKLIEHAKENHKSRPEPEKKMEP